MGKIDTDYEIQVVEPSTNKEIASLLAKAVVRSSRVSKASLGKDSLGSVDKVFVVHDDVSTNVYFKCIDKSKASEVVDLIVRELLLVCIESNISVDRFDKAVYVKQETKKVDYKNE